MKPPPPRRPPPSRRPDNPSLPVAAPPAETSNHSKVMIWVAVAALAILLASILFCSAAGIGVAAALKAFSGQQAGGESGSSAGEKQKEAGRSSADSPQKKEGESASKPGQDGSDSEPSKEQNGKAKQPSGQEGDQPPAGQKNGNESDGKQGGASGKSSGQGGSSSGGGSTSGDDSPEDQGPTEDDSMGVGAFFGIKDDGNSYVYVVDSSGSMLDGQRWERCREELVRSIRSLTADKKFFVILFSDTHYPMYWPQSLRPELVDCSSENIDRLRQWLAGFRVQGATNPESALLLALDMDPEVIFFLTDGEFNEQVPQAVQTANRKKIRINTICFESDTGSVLTRKIANENGGVYRFVK